MSKSDKIIFKPFDLISLYPPFFLISISSKLNYPSRTSVAASPPGLSQTQKRRRRIFSCFRLIFTWASLVNKRGYANVEAR